MDDGDSESIKEPSTYFKICMKNKGYRNRLILNYMCTQKPCHMRIDVKYTHEIRSMVLVCEHLYSVLFRGRKFSEL